MKPELNKKYSWLFSKEEKSLFYAGVLLIALGIFFLFMSGFRLSTSWPLIWGITLLVSRFLRTRKMYKTFDVLYAIFVLIFLGGVLYYGKGQELILGLIFVVIFILVGIFGIVSRKRETKDKERIQNPVGGS